MGKRQGPSRLSGPRRRGIFTLPQANIRWPQVEIVVAICRDIKYRTKSRKAHDKVRAATRSKSWEDLPQKGAPQVAGISVEAINKSVGWDSFEQGLGPALLFAGSTRPRSRG